MDNTTITLISVVIGLALFIVLRELNIWYWKINERISLAHKTNFLLEKILLQLGASDSDEIVLEEIATGQKKKVKIESWIEQKIKNPKAAKGYRTIKDTMKSENS